MRQTKHFSIKSVNFVHFIVLRWIQRYPDRFDIVVDVLFSLNIAVNSFNGNMANCTGQLSIYCSFTIKSVSPLKLCTTSMEPTPTLAKWCCQWFVVSEHRCLLYARHWISTRQSSLVQMCPLQTYGRSLWLLIWFLSFTRATLCYSDGPVSLCVSVCVCWSVKSVFYWNGWINRGNFPPPILHDDIRKCGYLQK